MDAAGQSLTINEARALADSVSEQEIGPLEELEGVLVGDAFDPQVQTLPREFDPS